MALVLFLALLLMLNEQKSGMQWYCPDNMSVKQITDKCKLCKLTFYQQDWG